MMKKVKATLDWASTVLIVVAASLFIWRQFGYGHPGPQPPVQDAKGVISAELVENARGQGSVALVEFADYECPYCGRHASEVAPAIGREFVQPGKLKEIFINYPLQNHSHAEKASEAAECAANQGHFWEMHDALFADQSALDLQNLSNTARRVGLDGDAFDRCLGSGETATRVSKHREAGRALAVSGTPAFFLGTVLPDGTIQLRKRINGALPLKEFEQQIDDLLPRQQAHRQ